MYPRVGLLTEICHPRLASDCWAAPGTMVVMGDHRAATLAGVCLRLPCSDGVNNWK